LTTLLEDAISEEEYELAQAIKNQMK